MNVVIQQLDIPNKNGRIYSKEVIQKALENAKEKLESGEMLGELCIPNDPNIISGDASPPVNLAAVSHVVKRMWIEDGNLMGEVKILDTPNGKILKHMLEHDELRNSVAFRPSGFGKIDENGFVSDYEFRSISVMPSDIAS